MNRFQKSSFEHTSLMEIAFLKAHSHPNIINLVSYMVDDFSNKNKLSIQIPRAVMTLDAWTAKTDLETRIKCLPSIIKQLLLPLEYLQDHFIVHGDLKPRNIVLFSESSSSDVFPYTLKIIDWGNVIFDHRYTKHQSCINCTYTYAAPEIQHTLKIYHIHSINDIFSLGMTLRYVITGVEMDRTVLEYQSQKRKTIDIDALSSAPLIRQIIADMLIVDHKKRLSATQLLRKYFGHKRDEIVACNMSIDIDWTSPNNEALVFDHQPIVTKHHRKKTVGLLFNMCNDAHLLPVFMLSVTLLDRYTAFSTAFQSVHDYQDKALAAFFLASVLRNEFYTLEDVLEHSGFLLRSASKLKTCIDEMLKILNYNIWAETAETFYDEVDRESNWRAIKELCEQNVCGSLVQDNYDL